MQLPRLPYSPGQLLSFYEEALSSLGALCERTWHDRIEVVAEGKSAALWNSDGILHSTELHFISPEVSGARDADREVFPGAPLTFKLAESLLGAFSELPLERVALASDPRSRALDPAVTEKLWRVQFPTMSRARVSSPFKARWHFSLVGLIRCEIQAIDQHWSLHRLAVALSSRQIEESLATELATVDLDPNPPADIPWPHPDPSVWSKLIAEVVKLEIGPQLTSIRLRQQNSLRRELERIDHYFAGYAAELKSRSTSSRIKKEERLAAAQAEHARRRRDQTDRHEIRVFPRIDALLLVAEPAWHSTVQAELHHQVQAFNAVYVPRTRQWHLPAEHG